MGEVPSAVAFVVPADTRRCGDACRAGGDLLLVAARPDALGPGDALDLLCVGLLSEVEGPGDKALADPRRAAGVCEDGTGPE